MPNPSTFGCCPHCGRGPGIREALDAIRATLQTVLVAQVLTGWRLSVVTTYVAGVVLVDHETITNRGLSALLITDALPL
jgi:hypothetical protein